MRAQESYGFIRRSLGSLSLRRADGHALGVAHGSPLRWHGRLRREVDVTLEEAQAILAALVVMAGERKENAAYALADLLSQRGLERPCETLVAWAQEE